MINADINDWSENRVIGVGLAFLATLFASVIGNSIVMWIVIAHKIMHYATNFFELNLSIAETLISGCNVALVLTYMIKATSISIVQMRRYVICIMEIFVNVNMLTTVALAIHRYRLVMNPLGHQFGPQSSLGIIAAIWLICILLTIILMYFLMAEENAHDESLVLTYVIIVIFLRILPLGTIAPIYGKTGLKLWRFPAIGEPTNQQVELVRRNQTKAKAMLITVLMFAVCWIPVSLTSLILQSTEFEFRPPFDNINEFANLFVTLYGLQLLHGAFRPTILYWSNPRYHRGFRKFFAYCRWICMGKRTEEPSIKI